MQGITLAANKKTFNAETKREDSRQRDDLPETECKLNAVDIPEVSLHVHGAFDEKELHSRSASGFLLLRMIMTLSKRAINIHQSHMFEEHQDRVL